MTRFLAAAVCCAAFAAPVVEKHGSVTLSRVHASGLQPQPVLDSSGVLHLVYYAGEPAGGDLFYVRSTDYGATFSDPIQVNTQKGSAVAAGTIRGGQIAIGRAGRVHVAWNGSMKAEPPNPAAPAGFPHKNPMLYSRLADNGKSFEPQRNLMQSSYALDGGGTIAADPKGNVYVAWHATSPGAPEREAGRQVWVAVSTDDGKTFAAEKPAWNKATGACACCGMSLFSARDGSLLALFRSATDMVHRDIYLLSSKDGAKSFAGAMIHPWELKACPMSSSSIVGSPGGTWAAWETAGQVYMGKITAGAIAQPVAAPGEGKGRKHPRLAINRKGEIALLWTEGMAFRKGGSLAWQLYDAAGKPLGDAGASPGVPAFSFAGIFAKPDGSFAIVY